MAQHDYNIANADGATVRADMNALNEAMATLNSGATAPTTTFANMFWADAANGLLKQRNTTNTGWITIGALDTAYWGLVLASGTNIFSGVNTFSAQLRQAKGADIASANPLVLGTDGNYFDVTGTTGFSSITCAAGTFFTLQFDGACTITHGAPINLPGGANITTAAGDEATFFATAANTVRCICYTKADGTPVVSSGGAWEFVSSASVTAAASVVSPTLASGYDYLIVLENCCPNTDSDALIGNVSEDDGSTWKTGASDYNWYNSFGETDNADTLIKFTPASLGNDAGNVNACEVLLFDPNSSGGYKGVRSDSVIMNDAATPQCFAAQSGAVYKGTTNAVNKFKIAWLSGGNFKAQGTVYFFRRALS